MTGLVHLYCGEGKGKTSAAVGLSVRAAGRGKRVLFAQFFKDGSSGEIASLRCLPTVTVRHCPMTDERFARMNETERAEARRTGGTFLTELLEEAAGYDLMVLDEAVSAFRRRIAEEAVLLAFLKSKPEELEVVLTGRNPSPELMAAADYITEMTKIKHPFDRRIPAREGIEF